MAWLIIIPLAIVWIAVQWACECNRQDNLDSSNQSDMDYLLRDKDDE